MIILQIQTDHNRLHTHLSENVAIFFFITHISIDTLAGSVCSTESKLFWNSY